eukprot:m.69977 g.69977  ORF g.69977 m.69977 type:complete len:497 (+) comp11657_c0_seq1:280-1770(+)
MSDSEKKKGRSKKTETNGCDEVDVDGITALTMTKQRRHKRSVSWTNTALPPLMLEDDHKSPPPSSKSSSQSHTTLSLEETATATTVLDAIPESNQKSNLEMMMKPPQQQQQQHLLHVSSESSRVRSNSDTKMLTHLSKKNNQQQDKALAYWRLEKEYRLVKDKLMAKIDECQSLEEHKDKLTSEMDDLAESLFTEAHNMVDTAKVEAQKSDKRYQEAASKAEVLQAEVYALKSVVEHQRQQVSELRKMLRKYTDAIDQKKGKHQQAKTTPHSPTRSRLSFMRRKNSAPPAESVQVMPPLVPEQTDEIVDVLAIEGFSKWFRSPSLDDPFVGVIVREEMLPTLQLCGKTKRVKPEEIMQAVKEQSVLMEATRNNSTSSSRFTSNRCSVGSMSEVDMNDSANTTATATTTTTTMEQENSSVCMLSNSGQCTHRIRLGLDDEWVFVSSTIRDRIASVCDCYLYLKYIHQGLVSSDAVAAYKKLADHRLKMMRTRLGFSL